MLPEAPPTAGPELSGNVTVTLADGSEVEVDAAVYMEQLKAEAQMLRAELGKAQAEERQQQVAISSSISTHVAIPSHPTPSHPIPPHPTPPHPTPSQEAISSSISTYVATLPEKQLKILTQVEPPCGRRVAAVWPPRPCHRRVTARMAGAGHL